VRDALVSNRSLCGALVGPSQRSQPCVVARPGPAWPIPWALGVSVTVSPKTLEPLAPRLAIFQSKICQWGGTHELAPPRLRAGLS